MTLVDLKVIEGTQFHVPVVVQHMALVSVGDEGDAITLSRTNKVTLVSIVISYSGYNTFLYRLGDNIGIVYW